MFLASNLGKYTQEEILDYAEECLLNVREGTGNDNIYLNGVLGIPGISNFNNFVGYFDSVAGHSTSKALIVDYATGTVQMVDQMEGAKDYFARVAEWYDPGLCVHGHHYHTAKGGHHRLSHHGSGQAGV